MHTRRNLTTGLVLAISMVGISYGVGGDMGAATEPWTDGSAAYPYLIEDLTDFDAFADPNNSETYWASGVYTKLTCDPNLTGRPYTTAVIAPDTSTSSGFQGTPFAGIFNGNGHIVRNLTIDAADADNDYLGLFGDNGGTITNCYATGSVTGGNSSDYLGGLCGDNGGTITNCYASGSVTGGYYSHNLGGLCGYNEGTIINCYAAGSVSVTGGGGDSGWLGGLCGVNDHGTITNCYATGSVTGRDHSNSLGGLCGQNIYGTITNCYATGLVTGDDGLGGLCGHNGFGTIANCYATGSVTGGDGSCQLGGLCGHNDSTITNCYATGSVTGGYDLGGLCGCSNHGTISNCYATGSVTGGNIFGYLGGLCGNNTGAITNCYATGLVTGDNSLGGLCGGNFYGTITNCYAAGSVTGGNIFGYLGGLCGYNEWGTIADCFWDVETSGMTDGVGNQDPDPAGVIGKTTEQMQTESTFTDANWDFTVAPVWHMPFEAIGYPMLGWQKDIPGDFTGRYGVDLADFAIFSNAWLSANTPTANWNEHCDLNANGVIDPGDLKIFAENWLCK